MAGVQPAPEPEVARVPDRPRPSPTSMRQRLLQLPPKWIAAALGAVLLAGTGLFGGLAEAQVAPSRIAIGEPVDVGPLTLQVTGVTAGEQWKGMAYDLKKGNRWVSVAATVVVDDSTLFSVVEQTVGLNGFDGVPAGRMGDRGAAPDRLMLVRDQRRVFYLNPGLREQVRFLWQQPERDPVPSSADVVVRRLTFFRDETSLVWGWGRPAEIGELTGLPVRRGTP